ncbi:MAG TPA: dephospho-CoA kinase [Thermoanaerobaculia bacterium]|nr:dephospho-CoA kinase [Thermoanaerobaculia bacterium]
MLRVGLTGGLASGKSTVARMLAELGASVFDADEIVRELYAPGGAGEAAAKELFGKAVLDSEGRIDRARIAGIVFADPARRHALEARIHPLVRAERARRFAEAERSGARVAVAEASQLLEAKTESDYDRVVLVVAPEMERLRRWETRGGDAEDARRRIASQIRPSEAFDRAQDVIVNDGSLEELRRKVADLYRAWTAGARPG